MDNTQKLKSACEKAVKSYLPENEVTYCNVGVSFICKEMGYLGFIGLLADDIVAKMSKDADWSEVTAEVAQTLANDGKVAVAGLYGRPHGHVAVVYPGTAVYSGKWRSLAPLIANVGAKNGIFGANYGFGEKPKYYAWIS